ncbi:MAG: MoxR family ATPase [Betaproteobacteria bacterium]|nr:MAG: MoxR family ATPase [Betaproteobacteria bacterium]
MKSFHQPHFDSVDVLARRFAAVDYIASRGIATAVYLGFNLEKPILVEGPAGVGKTELAKAMAQILDVPLIRMQCYEGLDESKALYEWKYGKQMLYTQLLKDKLGEMMAGAIGLAASMERLHAHDDLFFSAHFLEPRPLYQALHQERGCVLLVDEVDKSDPEFEAFLLEVLSDFQVSVPELGTIKAKVKPIVFLTSNNTREMSDALKRRCLHLHIPFPEPALERRILERRVPGLSAALNRELVAFIQAVRQLDLKKQPSISETIDWAKTLLLLNAEHLSLDLVRETLNVFLKFEGDIDSADEQLPALLNQARKDAEIHHASHA